MTEPLFSIGSYAAATGLTASALRFYAESGVLLPDHVDSSTGYRYYSSSSVETARLVSQLRAAGTPLEVLRLVIDSDPADAATTLEELAAERQADGVRVGEILREVAASLRQPISVGPMANVNGLELAAALRAASQFVAQEPPFDRVTLVAAEDIALEVVATDRFRLSAHRLADAFVASGSGRASLSADTQAKVISWLESAPCDVEITIADQQLTLTAPHTTTLRVPSLPDCLPDHRSLVTPLAGEHGRAQLDRQPLLDVLAGVDDTIELQLHGPEVVVGDQPVGAVWEAPSATGSITLTAPLLAASVAALPGPSLVAEWAEPSQPMHLFTSMLPHWRTVIMPARPDQGRP